jgi:hypothetical protein
MTQQDQYSYVMREWEEAWSQSRHLEAMRGQYLGFFFTAMIGVIAIAGPSLVDDSLRSAGSQILLATLAFGLQTLSGFLYLAVNRTNEVLRHYQEEIVAIRAVMIPASQDLVDLTPFKWPPKPSRDWATTSGVATRVLQSGLVVFPVTLACTAGRAVQLDGLSTSAIFCLVLALASIVVGLLAALGGVDSQKKRARLDSNQRPSD